MRMPPLETQRLVIRPFAMEDLDAIHRILDIELGSVSGEDASGQARAERQQWLQWTVLNYEELAKLYQPPYGDRAIVLKQSGQLIGACGFAPTLLPFEQLPSFGVTEPATIPARNTSEMGLYWAIAPAYQRQGYAAEAAQALITYALTDLNLKRVVATTSYDNEASNEL
jgi:ribosomal-protein-alanine N-acetyltransferase